MASQEEASGLDAGSAIGRKPVGSASLIKNAFAEATRSDEDEQIDMAAAVDAEIFGAATPKGAAWVQEAIRSRANFAQRLPDANLMTIGNGAGSLGNLSPEERKRKADEDSQEWFDSMIDMGERKRKEQLEREQREWDETPHSFAGQDLTGKEWAEFAESLKEGSKGQSWLINYLMVKQGMTESEATQYARDMKDAADGMATPNPTEKQAAAQTRIDANPKADEIAKDYRATLDQNLHPVSEQTTRFMNTAQLDSVDAGSHALTGELPSAAIHASEQRILEGAAMDRPSPQSIGAVAMSALVVQSRLSASAKDAAADTIFPSAPNLTAHHRAAVTATEPLDAKKAMQVAAAPQPSANAGLDV